MRCRVINNGTVNGTVHFTAWSGSAGSLWCYFKLLCFYCSFLIFKFSSLTLWNHFYNHSNIMNIHTLILSFCCKTNLKYYYRYSTIVWVSLSIYGTLTLIILWILIFCVNITYITFLRHYINHFIALHVYDVWTEIVCCRLKINYLRIIQAPVSSMLNEGI